MNLLEVRDLSVAYGRIEALHRVTISVAEGSIVTVIGPNGAGKTTLLASIIGLLPFTGDLHYRGNALASEGDNLVEQRVAQGMVLVPERRELFSAMSVEDNLLLGAFSRRRDKPEDSVAQQRRVFELFPRLKQRRAQPAGTLSGGERQMLALGRALMARPKLLMLDEPSLGLAPLVVREIFHIIAALRESGVSILLIEQNARAALQVADHGYVLETGDIALGGPAAELTHNPRVADSYLGGAARTA
jgi:branched-chain amino acid transport system ATP-binding protein